jgi:hypothetical protein
VFAGSAIKEGFVMKIFKLEFFWVLNIDSRKRESGKFPGR